MAKRTGLFFAGVAGLAAVSAVAQTSGTPTPDLAKVIANCESCHGPKGNSTSQDVPRLNGQQPVYIAARLRDLRYPTSQDPHAIDTMWQVATQTGDEMVVELADYFGRQTPTQSQGGNSAPAVDGAKLFVQGAAVRNVPACASCHGDRGQGARGVPRLAGQHGAYLTHALEVFRLALRESDVMHPALNEIDDQQIKALVAYLAND